MKILIPIAGPDDKFNDKEFGYSKNLVELDGKPLIEHVIDNLRPVMGSSVIFVIRKDEIARFHIDSVLRLLVPDCHLMTVAAPTAGAATTALLAIEEIDCDEELLIANGDQILTYDMRAALADFRARELDGGIVTFDSVHPRWSYVRVDDQGRVTETSEKRPISRHATAGLYYFRKGSDFVRAAFEMIRKDAHVNGKFFICPTYNEMILAQARLGIHEVPRSAYFSLATPQGVSAYEDLLKAKRVHGVA